MSRTRIAAVTLITLCLFISGAGCSRWFAKRSTPAATTKSLYAVSAQKAPFYRYGPQQVHGPDKELPKDTLVTLIRHSFGYSKVRLENGEQGFMANEDLTRASESLIAQVDHSDDEMSSLPPPPEVTLPVSDPVPDVEPTPLPAPIIP